MLRFYHVWALSLLLLFVGKVEACSRALYVSDNGTSTVSRSMDWVEDVPTTLWAFPPGISRTGDKASANPVQWTSKYGSVAAVAYNLTTDGLNDQGLAANILYLAESEYGDDATQGNKPTLQISMWGQYVLDNFANVSDAVEDLSKDSFRIVAPNLPDGHAATLHLAISDAQGDSAILEYVDGKLVIHHGKEFKVMTNSPIYDQQLALDKYWKQIGGLVSLPGTFKAADRFVRLSFLLESLPKNGTYKDMVATQLSIIRAISVPLGLSVPGSPNLAQTLWRIVSDSSNQVYYFDSAMRPNVFWVVLADLGLTQGGSIKKLEVTLGPPLAGNVAAQFTPTDPLVFFGTQ